MEINFQDPKLKLRLLKDVQKRITYTLEHGAYLFLGICGMYSDAMDTYKKVHKRGLQITLSSEVIDEHLPELLKYKPRGTIKYTYWWPLNRTGYKQRLVVINKIIDDVKRSS